MPPGECYNHEDQPGFQPSIPRLSRTQLGYAAAFAAVVGLGIWVIASGKDKPHDTPSAQPQAARIVTPAAAP